LLATRARRKSPVMGKQRPCGHRQRVREQQTARLGRQLRRQRCRRSGVGTER
jgi:hypothetical protein